MSSTKKKKHIFQHQNFPFYMNFHQSVKQLSLIGCANTHSDSELDFGFLGLILNSIVLSLKLPSQIYTERYTKIKFI